VSDKTKKEKAVLMGKTRWDDYRAILATFDSEEEAEEYVKSAIKEKIDHYYVFSGESVLWTCDNYQIEPAPHNLKPIDNLKRKK